jgi:hypothetical protein
VRYHHVMYVSLTPPFFTHLHTTALVPPHLLEMCYQHTKFTAVANIILGINVIENIFSSRALGQCLQRSVGSGMLRFLACKHRLGYNIQASCRIRAREL